MRVLFTCTVHADGWGDLAHLKDFYDAFLNYQKSLGQSLPKPLILLAYFKDKQEKIFSLLKEYQLISKETNSNDSPLEIYEKNDGFFLMSFVREGDQLKNDEYPFYTEQEHIDWLQSPVFQAALQEVKIIFNISNAAMLEKFQNSSYGYDNIFMHRPRIIHFPEVGGRLDEHYTHWCHAQYEMGLQLGMFFKMPNTHAGQIKDQSLLAMLLDKKPDELQESDNHALVMQQFRENSLFFPCYFKHSNSFYLYLLTFLRSPFYQEVVKAKEEIVVFSNIYYDMKCDKADAASISLHHLDLLQYLHEAGIDRLIYITREERIERDLPNLLISNSKIPKIGKPVHKKGKSLRIINTTVSSHDFEVLFRGNDVVGCSGDRSLANAIENLSVPFFEIRDYKIAELKKEMTKLDKNNLLNLALAVKANDIMTVEQLSLVADKLAVALTLENVNSTRKFLEEMRNNKNLFLLLPDIFKKEIDLAAAVNYRQINSLSVAAFFPRKNTYREYCGRPNLIPVRKRSNSIS